MNKIALNQLHFIIHLKWSNKKMRWVSLFFFPIRVQGEKLVISKLSIIYKLVIKTFLIKIKSSFLDKKYFDNFEIY